jgi:hypothetical protein
MRRRIAALLALTLACAGLAAVSIARPTRSGAGRIVGHIRIVGGPPTVSGRTVGGRVIVHAGEQLLASKHVGRRSGFDLRLPAGRYELIALHENLFCRRGGTVRVRAGERVRADVSCSVR